MDKLEIKNLSVVPARLVFSFVLLDNRNTRSTCLTSVFAGIGQTLMSRPVLYDPVAQMSYKKNYISMKS